MSALSTQRDLAEDIQRISGNVNGLFAKISDLIDRVEELEEENEELRQELEEARSTAQTAYSIAGEADDGTRSDGGPSKTRRAYLLSRNEVVRQALTTSSKGGSVTGKDVVQMAKPETDLYHRIVRRAWDKLETRWDCLHIQERDDRDNRLVVNVDDLEEDLVRVVDDDLSEENLTERFVGGVS